MGLLVPSGRHGYLPSNLARIADEITLGKPEIGWRGDTRLGLRIGVLTDRFGNEKAKRLEVWRDCEDGQDRRIGTWHITEADQILRDLIAMDVRTPGRVSAIDAIEKADEEVERQKSREFAEAYGPIAEHALALKRDLADNVHHMHGQAGFGESPLNRAQRRAKARKAKAKKR